MKPDGWNLLEAGEFEKAVKAFKLRIENLHSEGAVEPVVQSAEINLAMAYTFLGNADLSLPILDNLLTEDYVGTSDYAITGVARWILGRGKEAASHWEKGMGCIYADASGGMELPLLLYFAAVRDPSVYDIPKAKELLKKATLHPWANCWPGPLGNYVLDDIGETEARRRAIATNDIVTARQKTQVAFYAGVRVLESGRRAAFKDQMEYCAKIPNWHLANEFYLARYEASNFT